MCCMSVQRGHSGDACDLVSNLCRYNLRKGGTYLFIAETSMLELQ